MNRACETIQLQIMERWDKTGHVADEELRAHLKECETCREWFQFLRAESDTWAAVPSPALDGHDWARALTRDERRPLFLQWGVPIVGMVAAGLFVAIFLPQVRKHEPVVDTDLINAVVELDALTRLDTGTNPPEYLEQTGLVWTSEDLAILSEPEDKEPASGVTERRSPTSSPGLRLRYEPWLV